MSGGKRKDYRLGNLAANVLPLMPTLAGEKAWVFKYRGYNYDMRRYQGQGVDAIVSAVRDLFHYWAEAHINENSLRALYFNLRVFFAFLHELNSPVPQVTRVEDFTPLFAGAFTKWITQSVFDPPILNVTRNGQFKMVNKVVSGLLMQQGLPYKIFGRFPISTSSQEWLPTNEHKSFSRAEFARIVKALAAEIEEIRLGKTKRTDSHVLAFYLLLIAARTGRNTTALTDILRDALQENPFDPDSDLLVTYKRRGNTETTSSYQKGADQKITTSASKRVGALFRECLKITEDLANEAKRLNLVDFRGRRLEDFLFLSRRCQRASNKPNGCAIGKLKPGHLTYAVKLLVDKYVLVNDEGNPLQVTVSRLRKTFGNRVFEDSGGDLAAMARALGNSMRVARSNYLEVSDDMRRNFKFVGETLLKTFTGRLSASDVDGLVTRLGITKIQAESLASGQSRTGVSRCSDPSHGEYAPKKDGELCINWLNCFRCPNQVIFADDLHRLFSFYWLLIKEKMFMREGQWNTVYGWVIREIDESIAPKFSKAEVDLAKIAAFDAPYPMWRTRESLYGGAPS